MFCCFDFKNLHRYHQQCFYLPNMDLSPLVAPGGICLESGKLPENFPQICSWKRVVKDVDTDDTNYVEESIKTNLEMSSNLLSEAAKVNLDSASCLSRLSIDSSLETSPFSNSVRFRTCAFGTVQRSLFIVHCSLCPARLHICFAHTLSHHRPSDRLKCCFQEHYQDQSYHHIIIIVTRPKPVYGRQGLGEGSLCAPGAQLGSDHF